MGLDTAKHNWPSQNIELFYNQDGELDYWRKICRKYIRFKPEVIDRVKILQDRTAGKKILGVSIRGTDYTSIKPSKHPIQPTPEQVIIKAQEVMQEKNFDSIYLATEDKNIIAEFQQVFGEKLILPDCEYIDYDYNDSRSRFITTYFSDRKNDKYLRGLEYIVSKLFLLKCNGLITSITSGTTAIMCLSEGFEYLYVFDLGYYA